MHGDLRGYLKQGLANSYDIIQTYIILKLMGGSLSRGEKFLQNQLGCQRNYGRDGMIFTTTNRGYNAGDTCIMEVMGYQVLCNVSHQGEIIHLHLLQQKTITIPIGAQAQQLDVTPKPVRSGTRSF